MVWGVCCGLLGYVVWCDVVLGTYGGDGGILGCVMGCGVESVWCCSWVWCDVVWCRERVAV